jgi:hypothetical protein
MHRHAPRTHTHTQTRRHTRTRAQARRRTYLHTHANRRTHTRTHMRKRGHSHVHARTHSERTREHARKHARSHARAHKHKGTGRARVHVAHTQEAHTHTKPTRNTHTHETKHTRAPTRTARRRTAWVGGCRGTVSKLRDSLNIFNALYASGVRKQTHKRANTRDHSERSAVAHKSRTRAGDQTNEQNKTNKPTNGGAAERRLGQRRRSAHRPDGTDRPFVACHTTRRVAA